MTLFGGMSKGERNRIRTRVRTAMRVQAQDGPYLGGRPPYGYHLADAGTTPQPREGPRRPTTPPPRTRPRHRTGRATHLRRLRHRRRLRPARPALTDDGILSPSAHDPERNRHRAGSGGVWAKSAVKAILQNPRYTGYQSLGQATPRRGPTRRTQRRPRPHLQTPLERPKPTGSRAPSPPTNPLITDELFDQAQDIITAGTRPPPATARPRTRTCSRAWSAARSATARCKATSSEADLHYRCVMKNDYPGADHPRSLSVREDHLLPIVDDWLSQLFHPTTSTTPPRARTIPADPTGHRRRTRSPTRHQGMRHRTRQLPSRPRRRHRARPSPDGSARPKTAAKPPNSVSASSPPAKA